MAKLRASAALRQKLSSKLVVAPKLAQSLKILAMDSLELEQYIDSVLQSNPLLERETSEDEAHPAAEGEDALPDEDWERLYTAMRRDGDERREQNWQSEPSLSERLHRQLACEPMPEERKRIAAAIIDSLDDDGYFRADASELAQLCGCDERLLWDVLCHVVQQMEPAGIGARDVLECLELQLRDQCIDPTLRELAERMLHLESDALCEDDETLARKLDCSSAEVAAARACLRRLDPSPGRILPQHDIYVRPELYFHLRPNHEIEVEVRRPTGLGIRLDPRWQGRKWKEQDASFIAHAEREAHWLLHALAQRSETLLKVGCFLARHQRAFLIHGPASIRPLTLSMVAEACGVHESTVSRITHGKYAQTPLGVIEMRHFFSAGLETRNGEMVAVSLVIRRIRKLIENEDPSKPLSDQALLDRLKQEGIHIARRTVTKYREQLGFPSTRQRRRKAVEETR